MSETLRGRLTSYLSTAIMFMMVFGVMWQAMPVPFAHAADGDAMGIQLLDGNVNGQIDTIMFAIENAATATWEVNGTPGITATYNGADVTVSSVTITSAVDANPIAIQVSLDESDSDLSVNTSVDYIELIYTQAGGGSSCTDCLKSSAVELSAIATGDAGANTEVDGAAPVVWTIHYKDSDSDGGIDRFDITFSEDVVAGSFLSQNDLSVSNVGDFTDIAFSSSVTDVLTGTVDTISMTLGTESSASDTYEGSSNFEITSQNAFSLVDGDGNTNSTLAAQSQVVMVDAANPVISSSTPTDTSTTQSRVNSVVWNFSEPMDTSGGWVHASEFTASPNPGGWGTAVWSNSDTTVTISHAPFLCVTSYSIVTDDTVIDATNGGASYTPLNDASTAPIGEALTFTTASCSSSSSSSSSSTEVTYDLDVLTPNGGETLTEGEEYEITWETSDEGSYYIDLSYLDGEDYIEIVTGENNDGSYTWTVPADVEDSMIKAVWTDLADEMDSDISDEVFNVSDSTEDTEEVVEEVDETTDAVAPSGTGISPVTGEEEEITAVEPGDFITSPSFSTVYYVTEDFERRTFISSAVYFTYADSYDEIKDVTDATLTALDLADNMLPNPGVVLVKVQSDARTYAVDSNYDLRWITSEEVAIELYGANWADYIIDVEATFFGAFGTADDIDSADDITVGDMKTREEISQ